MDPPAPLTALPHCINDASGIRRSTLCRTIGRADGHRDTRTQSANPARHPSCSGLSSSQRLQCTWACALRRFLRKLPGMEVNWSVCAARYRFCNWRTRGTCFCCEFSARCSNSMERQIGFPFLSVDMKFYRLFLK